MSDYGDNKSLLQLSLIRLICLYYLIQKNQCAMGDPVHIVIITGSLINAMHKCTCELP